MDPAAADPCSTAGCQRRCEVIDGEPQCLCDEGECVDVNNPTQCISLPGEGKAKGICKGKGNGGKNF